jgi:hypothetical protein
MIVAAILLQTLFFKFTGARESVYIFATLGAEPWGRIASGIFELISSVFLIAPRTITIGALMALAATGTAIVLHLTILGVALEAVGDRGELFALAVVVVLCSLGLLWMHRKDLRSLVRPAAGRYTRAARAR